MTIKRIGIFDTETTGLIKNRLTALGRQPEIIEFYLGIYNPKGKKIDEYGTLIKPRKPITEEITGMNNISNEMVENAPGFAQVAIPIKKALMSCDRLVAHNMAFDRDMVDIEMERAQMTVDWPPVMCTVEQSQVITGNRLKLMQLHMHLFGEGFEEAHRASKDVAALARCYFELVKRGEIIQ